MTYPTALVVVLLLLCVSAWAEPGLVAHYTCEEGSGQVAVDHSGNGNDSKLAGGVTWAKGAFGTALEFNGVDGYEECPFWPW